MKFLIKNVFPPTTRALFFQLTWLINQTVNPFGSLQFGMDKRAPKPISFTHLF
jgi:hypothetical protein